MRQRPSRDHGSRPGFRWVPISHITDIEIKFPMRALVWSCTAEWAGQNIMRTLRGFLTVLSGRTIFHTITSDETTTESLSPRYVGRENGDGCSSLGNDESHGPQTKPLQFSLHAQRQCSPFRPGASSIERRPTGCPHIFG